MSLIVVVVWLLRRARCSLLLLAAPVSLIELLYISTCCLVDLSIDREI